MSALRAAFDEERAWLRAAADQRAVLDRLAGYRVNMATARRVGNAQGHAFAEHLVELAEDRLAELKALAWRAQERAAAPSAKPRVESPPPPKAAPTPPQEPPARPEISPPRLNDSAVVRQLQEALAASQEAGRRAERERHAADRRARDASAERDLVVAARKREQGRVSAMPPAPAAQPPVTDGGGRLFLPAKLPSAPTSQWSTSAARSPTATAPAAMKPPATTASPGPVKPDGARERAPSPEASMLRSAPPTAPPKPTASPMPSAPPAAPADARSPAPLTGADLAAFRRGAGLTQVAAAQRLGVTQGTISKAEGNPRTALGPALQEAMRRAAG